MAAAADFLPYQCHGHAISSAFNCLIPFEKFATNLFSERLGFFLRLVKIVVKLTDLFLYLFLFLFILRPVSFKIFLFYLHLGSYMINLVQTGNNFIFDF